MSLLETGDPSAAMVGKRPMSLMPLMHLAHGAPRRFELTVEFVLIGLVKKCVLRRPDPPDVRNPKIIHRWPKDSENEGDARGSNIDIIPSTECYLSTSQCCRTGHLAAMASGPRWRRWLQNVNKRSEHFSSVLTKGDIKN